MNVDTSRAAAAIVLLVLVYALVVGVRDDALAGRPGRPAAPTAMAAGLHRGRAEA